MRGLLFQHTYQVCTSVKKTKMSCLKMQPALSDCANLDSHLAQQLDKENVEDSSFVCD